MLLPWNQTSLQIYNRAVEWAGSSHELCSIVTSAKFDAGFSDTCREGRKEKERERKRKNRWWFPTNALLAHRWCARYGKVQCLICEVKRTQCLHWGDSPTNGDVAPAVAQYMAQPTSLPWKHVVQSKFPGVGHSLLDVGHPAPWHLSMIP